MKGRRRSARVSPRRLSISKHDHGTTDFRSIAENSADVICRVDPDLAFVYLSGSIFNVLGWSPAELIGKPPDALVIAEDLPVWRQLMHTT